MQHRLSTMKRSYLVTVPALSNKLSMDLRNTEAIRYCLVQHIYKNTYTWFDWSHAPGAPVSSSGLLSIPLMYVYTYMYIDAYVILHVILYRWWMLHSFNPFSSDILSFLHYFADAILYHSVLFYGYSMPAVHLHIYASIKNLWLSLGQVCQTIRNWKS